MQVPASLERSDWGRRARASAEVRIERLRGDSVVILQGAVAAAAAWVIAVHVLGHQHPFFAPLAALIATGMTHQHRTRRTVELVIGVALGIGVADLLVAGIGVGIWQLFLVVILASAVAVLLGPGRFLAGQAAVSAMLVATVQPPGSGLAGQRFLDALLGGSIALLAATLLPAHPVRAVEQAAQRVLNELGEVLDELSHALRSNDVDRARGALARVRALDEHDRHWREAVDTGYEITRTAPAYRARKPDLDSYATVAAQMDFAQRNIRVLARAVVRAIDLRDDVPSSVPESLTDLATAVRHLAGFLAGTETSDQARAAALAASAGAVRALRGNTSLYTSVIVGQVRFTAVDLLRGLGEERALTAVGEPEAEPVAQPERLAS